MYTHNQAPLLPKLLQSLTQTQEGMSSLGNLKDSRATAEQVPHFQIFWNLGWANHARCYESVKGGLRRGKQADKNKKAALRINTEEVSKNVQTATD